ncbi:hypothetical protein Xen7305DRAFT_00008140 [Xenococcus sp. PCC 7305]|uniref:hypothetical protein n=1 Tax=Xenococcus sp. PCC 7305 TaxID=102125 RepID=UPI0002AC345C|nr:hypothetical protein [Xenococcus sp. PCC 7305]ELS01112.1 hypothetical protein Xen7305DRAFT_00008140 [Xenococcus sp. PCC 7305]
MTLEEDDKKLTPEDLTQEPELDLEPDTEDVFEEADDEPLGAAGKKALIEERNKAKRLAKQLAKYKNIDLDEYQKIQEEKQKTEEQRLKDQQQWETLSKRQNLSIKQKDQVIDELQAKVQELTKATELKDVFYAHEGLRGKSGITGKTYFDEVKQAISARTRRERDGSYTVLDTDGLEQKNDRGEPMTVDELIEQIREDQFYGHYFSPKTKNGTGFTSTRSGLDRSATNSERFEALKKKMGYQGKNKGKTIFN